MAEVDLRQLRQEQVLYLHEVDHLDTQNEE
jgi:hypothetical protein